MLNRIEENLETCCGITMEQDEVLEIVDKIKNIINGNN